MNKRHLAAAVAAMITLTTGVAMANPVDLDGSISYRYRSDSNTGSARLVGNIMRFTLNAKTNVATNLDVYARFAFEGLSEQGRYADFRNNGKATMAEFDQYGLLYKNAGFTYKLGQQAPTLGATGLIYDASGNLGQKGSGVVDGINIKGKSGVTSVDFLAAQENNVGPIDNKIYAIRGSYNPTQALTLGATVAQYKPTAAANQNFYAGDASYAAGKATYTAEYAKSNASTKNKAYTVGVSYAADAQNTVWVSNYKVEGNGSINGMTAFDPGYKGFYYGADHSFTKDTALHLFYRNMEDLSTSAKNTSFRATVSYNF